MRVVSSTVCALRLISSELSRLTSPDWEDASLPGGLTSSFRGTVHESLNKDIVAPSLIPPRQNIYQPRPPPSFPGREDYRSNLRNIAGVAHRVSGPQSRREPTNKKRPLRNAGFIKSQSDVPPDAYFQMSQMWKVLVSNIRVGPYENPAEIARDSLDELCLKTDAFIGTPLEEETKIPIWGDKEQVDQALTELQAFELHVRRVGVRPKQAGWHKDNAFDGRVASRKEEEEREQAMAEGLRLMEEGAEFDFEAYLLWPDEIDIDRFASQHDSTFKQVRGEILSRIQFIPTGIKHVKVSANSEVHIKKIYMRLLNMVKEDIAQIGKFLVANRFRLPRARQHRDRVGLDKDLGSNLYLPTLNGNPLPDSETEDWDRLCVYEDEKNRNLISTWIDSSLKSLQASQRHVRMRITFGELGFSQLELPADGDDNYDFEEFCSMIVKRRTTIQSLGIRTSRGNLSDLVDVLADFEQFSELEMRCVLHFDFQGHDNHTLRFESEFKHPFASDEMEVFSSRWLEFGTVDDSEILEVNLLDFEHLQSNCQFHIGAIKLYTLAIKGSNSELRSFESNVRFKAPTSGIRAPPRRRATYPPGRQDLYRVEEIYVARFRFKQGNGYFELQRKDIYSEHEKTATPLRSIWTARYYYPEWDNIMGEFASLKPGEEVRWARNLGTFFVDPKAAYDSRVLPRGFEAFMEEIQELSALLQEAIEKLEGFGRNGSHANGH